MMLLKLLSPAYAVKWILVDGLRPDPQLRSLKTGGSEIL